MPFRARLASGVGILVRYYTDRDVQNPMVGIGRDQWNPEIFNRGKDMGSPQSPAADFTRLSGVLTTNRTNPQPTDHNVQFQLEALSASVHLRRVHEDYGLLPCSIKEECNLALTLEEAFDRSLSLRLSCPTIPRQTSGQLRGSAQLAQHEEQVVNLEQTAALLRVDQR